MKRVTARTSIGGRSYLPGDAISDIDSNYPILLALEEHPPLSGENNTILIKYSKE